MKHASAFINLVLEAKRNINEIDVATVKKKVARKEDFMLIDVREDREWESGHLPNAKHIGKGVIERDIERLIPDRQVEIILYCGGGYRSALATESLQKMGYTNVWSMDGGFKAWSTAE